MLTSESVFLHAAQSACSAYASALKIQAVLSFETSMNYYRTRFRQQLYSVLTQRADRQRDSGEGHDNPANGQHRQEPLSQSYRWHAFGSPDARLNIWTRRWQIFTGGLKFCFCFLCVLSLLAHSKGIFQEVKDHSGLLAYVRVTSPPSHPRQQTRTICMSAVLWNLNT